MDAKYYAIEIVKKLARAGHTAYFAGGWVRDFLMKHPSSDIDIATDAHPERILDLFPRTTLVGLAFGVVIVNVDGHQFEVSSFRKDISYLNGRKPEKIELSNAFEDAKRRDFTINGMFYDPLEEKIHDFVNGKEDIRLGIIRTIGDPNERFLEDRLRMIRAVRFAARFGFTIDPETRQGIIENADFLFPAVAMERVLQEFNKMAAFPRFDQALLDMQKLYLLPVIFPKLNGIHFSEIKHHLRNISRFPPGTPAIIYLAQLFPSAKLEELLDLCQYLKTSNKETKLVEFIFLGKQIVEREAAGLPISDVEWVRFYAHPFAKLCLEICAANYDNSASFWHTHQQRMDRLSAHINRAQKQTPLVNASLLKQNGISEGKGMGVLIKEAEQIAIAHNLHSPEETMNLLKKTVYWPK